MANTYTPEEISEIIQRYNDELLTTGKVSRELQEEFRNAQIGVKNYTYQLNQSLKQLGSSIAGTMGAIANGKTDATAFNGAIDAAGNAVNAVSQRFGVLGKALGLAAVGFAKFAQAALDQSNKLASSYQDISRFGAIAEEGGTGLFKLNQQLGYGVEELDSLRNIISKNAETFATLGGTAVDGTKAFGNLAQSFQRGDLLNNFLNLGMSVDGINTGLANYIAIQSRTGVAQRSTQQQLTQGANAYLERLDLLSKLTGQSAEAIAEEQKQRMADQQFRAVQRELQKKADAGDEQARQKLIEIDKLMAQAGPEARKAIVQAMTGFVGAGKEGEKLYMTSARAFKMLNDPLFKASDFMEVYAQDAERTADSFATLAKLGNYNEVFLDFAAGLDAAAKRTKSTYAEQEDAARAQQDAQRNNLDSATAANIQLQKGLRDTRDGFQNLINLGVKPLTQAMAALARGVSWIVSKIPGTSSPGTEAPSSGGGGGGGGAPPPAGAGLAPRSAVGSGAGSAAAGSRPPGDRTAALLNLIGQAESGNRYNVLVGGTTNSNLPDMTVAQVLALQSQMKTQGFESTAVGRYQIIQETLQHLVTSGVVGLQDKFSSSTQDRLAVALMERRGYSSFRSGQMSPEMFANQLAKEWASLPTESGRSYYQGVGSNQAKVSRDALMSTLSAARGGILSGPISGYQATLHGTEAVIPLASGQSVPVNMEPLSRGIQAQTELMNIQLAKLDELIMAMQDNAGTSKKILQRTK